MNILLKICRNLPYTSKDNCQKESSKLIFFIFLFYFSKMAKTVFDLKHFVCADFRVTGNIF